MAMGGEACGEPVVMRGPDWPGLATIIGVDDDGDSGGDGDPMGLARGGDELITGGGLPRA